MENERIENREVSTSEWEEGNWRFFIGEKESTRFDLIYLGFFKIGLNCLANNNYIFDIKIMGKMCPPPLPKLLLCV